MAVRIDVLIDSPADQPYHQATLAALEHAIDHLGVEAHIEVVPTDTIDDALLASPADAVVIGPGTPYRRPDLAELVIAGARERGVPLVGT